jgi:hypothetical protein
MRLDHGRIRLGGFERGAFSKLGSIKAQRLNIDREAQRGHDGADGESALSGP